MATRKKIAPPIEEKKLTTVIGLDMSGSMLSYKTETAEALLGLTERILSSGRQVLITSTGNPGGALRPADLIRETLTEATNIEADMVIVTDQLLYLHPEDEEAFRAELDADDVLCATVLVAPTPSVFGNADLDEILN
jgi:hypothetical protein